MADTIVNASQVVNKLDSYQLHRRHTRLVQLIKGWRFVEACLRMHIGRCATQWLACARVLVAGKSLPKELGVLPRARAKAASII